MGFSAKQLQALRRNVDERHIRTRESNGRELSYIEGWYAIAQANRIFGFDGWSRETVDSKCVLARENRGTFLAVYTAKVRVTVYPQGSNPIVREGHGTGEGRGNTPGEVHDMALKAAETDATKRALATFGRPFGLELYRGHRKDSSNPSGRRRSDPSPSIVPAAERQGAQPQVGTSLAGQVTPPAVARIDGPSSGKDAAGPHPSRGTSLGATPAGQKADQAPGAPSSSPQPPAGAERHPNREPDLLSPPILPPDGTTPIPRPSRHYGRREYLASRECTGTLMHELAQRAEASLRATEPTPQKIDKSVLTFGEPKRLRDKAHLRFVASQPCLICGRQPADAHHLRFSQPQALGRKVSDEFTVPLCRGHHREVHQTGNEVGFWEDMEIDALEIAKGLWEQSRSNSRRS